MPLTLSSEEELIPVPKLMQINKIVHPRLDPDYLVRRRQFFTDKDWASYDSLVKKAFKKNI